MPTCFVLTPRTGVFTIGGGQNLPSPVTNYAALQTYLLVSVPDFEALVQVSLCYKALFLEGPFYVIAVTSVRFSLTCLYRRIFVTPAFRRISIGTDCVSAAWFVMAFLVAIFSCTPVDYLWNPREKGSCLPHYNQYYLTREVLGTILDAVILLLPIRTIMNLQMPRRSRFQITGIFLLGGL